MKARLKNMIFDIKEGENGKDVLINGKSNKVEILNLENGSIELIINNKNYKSNYELKKNSIQINDSELGYFEIDFPSEGLLLAEQMDAQSASQNQSGTVKAQMPGLITKLMVEEGQKVAMNQTLFILEAMKMENAIQSETSGTVGQILVKEGQSVSKGDLILEISE